MDRVTLRVPASTANLGPGFDSLGCALGLYNTFCFEKSDSLRFQNCDEAFCNEDNLAYKAYKATLAYAGVNPTENVAVTFLQTDIPISRGLGSSAALLVAGAMGANALYDLGLDKQDLLTIDTILEGHPDNISPVLNGGLTASAMADGQPVTVSYPVNEALRFVVLIPDFSLSTQKARAVLPKTVAFGDAVHNLSRVALLPAAFASADQSLLKKVFDDRLHQPYRRTLIPGFDTAEQLAYEEGCLGFFLSGAGPTCLCLTDRSDFAQIMQRRLADTLLASWSVKDLPVDRIGASIV